MNLRSILRNILQVGLSKAGYQTIFRPKSKGIPPTVAVKTKFGFWYAGNIFDSHDIAYGILQNGDVEPDETKLFISIVHAIEKEISTVNKTLTVYDVGAHTGYYSFISTYAVPSAIVHAFEPLPYCVQTMKDSMLLNSSTDHIHVHQIGLSNVPGQQDFFVAGSGSSLNQEIPPSFEEIIKIKTERLDDYIQDNQLPTPDIMKIDIEGHEHIALDGMEKLLTLHKPVLFLEIIHMYGNRPNPNFETTLKKLNACGYKIYIAKYEQPVVLQQIDIANLQHITLPDIHMYTCIHSDHSNLHEKIETICANL